MPAAGYSRADLDALPITEATGLPYAPITRPHDLFDDPHLLATGGLADITLPDGERAGQTAQTTLFPFTMDGQRLGVRLQRSERHDGIDQSGVERRVGGPDRTVDDQRVGDVELRETFGQGLGLGFLDLRAVDHDEPAVLGLGGQRVLERQRTDFLGQVGGMRTHHRAERTTAAAELRHAGRAVTGATGALLLVHLLAGAPDLGAALRLVRAGLALVELPLHATGDDVRAGIETEDRIRELDRTGFLAFKGRDFQFHLTRPPSRPALP